MNSIIITSVSKEQIKKWPDIQIEDELKFCPVSGTKGLKVKKVTLRGHVFEKYWDIISDEDYYFCPNKDCAIAYFNNSKKYFFSQNDVKTRVSHKIGSEPRPICYCLDVLEHRILDEILVKKRATTLEEIKKYTGARTGKFCHITNPSGRCCGPQVNQIIAKGIKLLKEPDQVFVEKVLETVHSGCEYCKHEMDLVEPSIDLVVDACKSCDIAYEPPNSSKLEELN